MAGYLGNREGYNDPKNSYLNEVLDRKLGIPITLSALGIAVGRRLGVRLDGIGMPGHFLLRSPDGPTYFDPFAGGLRVAEEDCRERLRTLYGPDAPWSPQFLEPTPKRAILMRMLLNLKRAYLVSRDFRRARRVVEFFLVLAPDSQQDRELLNQLRDWEARRN